MNTWSAIVTSALCGLFLMATQAFPETAPRKKTASASRKPAVVRITEEHHAHVQKRIEEYRARLPEEFQNRKNFAWAVALVDGVDKQEYYAHSGINTLDDLSKEAAALNHDISICPEHQEFKTLCVNRRNKVDSEDCWDRTNDTEFKIIEDLNARLGNRVEAYGRMRLYTDLYPCASCMHVMKQFMNKYPNIQLEVLYKN